MAKFEVIKLDRDKTITKIVNGKDADGNKISVLEYEDVTIKVGAYGYEDIHVGDVLELSGHLAEKARRNTEYFREVRDEKPKDVQVQKEESVEVEKPKRRGRPPKSAVA